MKTYSPKDVTIKWGSVEIRGLPTGPDIEHAKVGCAHPRSALRRGPGDAVACMDCLTIHNPGRSGTITITLGEWRELEPEEPTP